MDQEREQEYIEKFFKNLSKEELLQQLKKYGFSEKEIIIKKKKKLEYPYRILIVTFLCSVLFCFLVPYNGDIRLTLLMLIVIYFSFLGIIRLLYPDKEEGTK
jgi:ribosomal protein S21